MLLLNEDLLIACFGECFTAHQQLLIELFAGAQADLLNGDILIQLQSGQADEVFRQFQDLHRLAHIQNEDLALLCHSTRLEHQLGSLGNGHKIADDAPIRDGDGAALLDLLFEKGHNRAIGTKHIAKPHRAEFCGAVRPALQDHLAESLGSAHEVGGIHSLIRGDHDKFLDAELLRRPHHMICAENVILDGLLWAFLHQRDMLVGRRMEHDVGAIHPKQAVNFFLISHGGDLHPQVQPIAPYTPQLLLDIISVVLVNIQNDELLGLIFGDLTAKLAADGTAAAGHQHGLPLQEIQQNRRIQLHRLSAKEIFHLHILHRRHAHLAVYQLVNSRQAPYTAARFLADVQDLFLILGRRCGDGKDDLCDPLLFDHLGDLLPPADDGHVPDVLALLALVVVDDAADMAF